MEDTLTRSLAEMLQKCDCGLTGCFCVPLDPGSGGSSSSSESVLNTVLKSVLALLGEGAFFFPLAAEVFLLLDGEGQVTGGVVSGAAAFWPLPLRGDSRVPFAGACVKEEIMSVIFLLFSYYDTNFGKNVAVVRPNCWAITFFTLGGDFFFFFPEALSIAYW